MDESAVPEGGGNIYFIRMEKTFASGSKYDTEFTIPFSNRYICGNTSGHGRTPEDYERAGIIGGVMRCGVLGAYPFPCPAPGLYYTREVILPQPPPGAAISPHPGSHYVPWGHNFTFTLSYPEGVVCEVYTNRLISPRETELEILTGMINANGEYEYTLPFVKTQPIYIYIGPNRTGTEDVTKSAVRAYNKTIHITVPFQDIASIYSITGMSIKRIEVPEGGAAIPVEQRGIYIVTLKDGVVHKVVVQ